MERTPRSSPARTELQMLKTLSLAIVSLLAAASCTNLPAPDLIVSNELPQRLSLDVPVEGTELFATVEIGASATTPRAFLDQVAGSYALRVIDTPVPTATDDATDDPTADATDDGTNTGE